MQCKFNIFSLTQSLLGIAASGAAIALLTNNPSQGDYAQVLTDRFHGQRCQQTEAELCELLSPLTRPTLKGLLYAYTTSYDYQFFTIFETRMPCLDVYGLNLFGIHFVKPVPDQETISCRVPTARTDTLR